MKKSCLVVIPMLITSKILYCQNTIEIQLIHLFRMNRNHHILLHKAKVSIYSEKVP